MNLLNLGMIHIWRPWKLSNFQDPLPPVHLFPKFFHPLDLGRPISNEPPAPNYNQSVKKIWSKDDYYMLSTKFIIIKRWFHCLTSESKGRFLVINKLMFGSEWWLVITQIQFSLIQKIKIGSSEHSLIPQYLRLLTSHFCLISPPPLKVDAICVSPLTISHVWRFSIAIVIDIVTP